MDEQRSAGRDCSFPTKPAVFGRSIEAPLPIELDEQERAPSVLLRGGWSSLRIPRRRPRRCWYGRGPAAEERRAPRPAVCGSEAQRAVDGDHRGATRVDGVDDLGVIDALEVDRGDAEVGVA